MVFFTLSTFTLLLSTLASSAPTSTPTYSKDFFTLALKANNYPALPLNAVQSAAQSTLSSLSQTRNLNLINPLGELSLIFQAPASSPGTPAYINATQLTFILPSSSPPFSHYTTSYFFLGDNYGASEQIYAFPGNVGTKGFSITSDNTLGYAIDSAEQGLFACNSTIGGEEVLALSFGVYNENETPPTGCVTAQVVQQYNVEV
jgi:hypothetical protein